MKARKWAPDGKEDMAIIALQWGRADEGAEIREVVEMNERGLGFNGAAPMKARKCDDPRGSRGNVPRFNGAAPMKARKCLYVQTTSFHGAVLQWGRADEGAEISEPCNRIAPQTPLQWGRADEGAEIQPPASTPQGTADASMGPRR